MSKGRRSTIECELSSRTHVCELGSHSIYRILNQILNQNNFDMRIEFRIDKYEMFTLNNEGRNDYFTIISKSTK